MWQSQAVPDPSHPEPLATGRSWLDPLCRWVAPTAALLVTTSRLGWLPHWADDPSLVGSVELLPVGAQGVLTMAAAQLALLLPIGGKVLRVAFVGALATAVVARLLYGLARTLLERNAVTPQLTPPLSLAAALSVTLSPSWQQEATRAGGCVVAAALCLGLVAVRSRARRASLPTWMVMGVLLGALAAESRPALAIALAALALHALSAGELPSLSRLAASVLTAVGVAAALLIPPLQRSSPLPLPRDWLRVAPAVFSESTPAGYLVWQRELGAVSLVIAGGGAFWALSRGGLRWRAAGLAALLLGDAAAGTLAPLGGASVSALLPSSLALAALGCLGALGAQTAVVTLRGARLPFAAPAAVLLVVFQLTLLLVAADQSAKVGEPGRGEAAELWTDNTLCALPAGSLLLVRDDLIAWRLWAARATRGERPDLIVVPAPLLVDRALARQLLGQEPALAGLMRDLAMSGEISEYSLSTLADVRPVYLEPSPSWSTRMLDHLMPEGMWLRFVAHPVGRSDRRAALDEGWGGYQRVLRVATDPATRDRATLSVLEASARQQAVAFAGLGDRSNLSRVMRELGRIDPDDGFMLALRDRAEAKPRGRVEVRDLLADPSAQ